MSYHVRWAGTQVRLAGAQHRPITSKGEIAEIPFSYAAGNAASYSLAPFRQDRHGYAERKTPTGRAKKSRNEISVVCNAIISVQYVILYYIVGPTCRGLNGHVRASLKI